MKQPTLGTLRVTLITCSQAEAGIKLIAAQPVMERATVTAQDQAEIVAMLRKSNLNELAGILEGFSVLEFEDFLVTECGED